MQDILSDFRRAFENDSNFCFADTEDDKIVAYVKTMTGDYIKDFPDTFKGKQVKLNFVCSKKIDKNLYVTYVDFEIDYFKDNLKRLLHIYGARVLSSVVYEFQLNEINVRKKYPHLDTEISRFINRYSMDRVLKEFEDLRTPDVVSAE